MKIILAVILIIGLANRHVQAKSCEECNKEGEQKEEKQNMERLCFPALLKELSEGIADFKTLNIDLRILRKASREIRETYSISNEKFSAFIQLVNHKGAVEHLQYWVKRLREGVDNSELVYSLYRDGKVPRAQWIFQYVHLTMREEGIRWDEIKISSDEFEHLYQNQFKKPS